MKMTSYNMAKIKIFYIHTFSCRPITNGLLGFKKYNYLFHSFRMVRMFFKISLPYRILICATFVDVDIYLSIF